VAYESEDQIWVRPYPEGEPVEQVSTAGGRLPRWRRDGNAIFYIENDTLMEVQLTIGATVKAGLPRNVFAAKNFLEGGGYAVFQDGKRFLVTEPVDPIPRPTITVVRNWTAMLAGKR